MRLHKMSKKESAKYSKKKVFIFSHHKNGAATSSFKTNNWICSE
jgi:hypothetical protein